MTPPLPPPLQRVVSVLLAGHESSQVLGGTEDEITGFVPLVLSMSPPPDIIILDQNLDSPERPSVQVSVSVAPRTPSAPLNHEP